MSTTVAVDNAAEVSIFEQRQTARRRAWICPGAAFGMFGYRGRAAVTYLTGLATMAAAVWTVAAGSRTAMWTTFFLLLVSTIAWVWELGSTYSLWPAQAPSRLAERYRWGAAAIWVLVGVLIVLVLMWYRVLHVDGEGMAPTVRGDERLVYRLGTSQADLKNDTPVLFKLSRRSMLGEPGTYVLGRILAVPGDKLKIRNDRYYVNDQAKEVVGSAGENLITLNIQRHPNDSLIPEDKYFIVQDSGEFGLDSRVFYFVSPDDVVSTRMWSLALDHFLEPIE